MRSLHLRLFLFCFLASQCASKTPIQRGFGNSQIQKRADFHTDHVHDAQCDHGKPESFRGQESRFEPSRQYLPVQESRVEPSRAYLPQPGPVPPTNPPPNDIEAPAASFEQPNFLKVENTYVSPAIQKNFKSLFQNKKDVIAPAAAQNPPSNALPPPSPRITSDKKHSHDDENNLERLCNDAFHSFLCKPIKGPRKTPTGRLRPNAVIPPDVLSGLASFQQVARVKPDPPKPATQPPRPYSQYPTTRYTPPPTTTKKYEPFIPEIPSPSNNNVQFLKPSPSNNAPLKAAAQTNGYFYEKPSVPFPSNQNQQFVPQQPTYQPPKPAPTKGYSYDRPSIPFPSNTVQKYAQPPKHDCDKAPSSSLVPNPSNENPAFIRPYSPTTPRPTTPRPTTTTQKYTQPPKHDCDKPHSPFLVPNPSNENPAFIRPFSPSTPKPTTKSYYASPVYSSPSSYTPFRSASQPTKPPQPHDCQKHSQYFAPSTEKPKLPLPSNNVARILAPSTPKPFVQSYYQKPIFPSPSNEIIRTSPPPQISTHDCTKHSPFIFSTTEKTRIPSASNNIAQIIGQPQTINSVTISPQKPTGYSYEKPAVPFTQPPRPTTPRPTLPPFTYQTTRKPGGYNYEQPRIPFPSNNIAQIISQPTTTRPTTTPKVPCEHDKPSFPVISNPTNQNSVVLKPAAASDAYFYDKPNQPFNGYNYDKPANPFLLPSPANNPPEVIASPAQSGYSYEKPKVPFPPQANLPTNNNPVITKPSGYSYEAPKIPFPTNINSKIVAPDSKPSYEAKPQTQVEVKVRPGYSYEKPSNPFTGEQGYTYPEPAAPFR